MESSDFQGEGVMPGDNWIERMMMPAAMIALMASCVTLLAFVIYQVAIAVTAPEEIQEAQKCIEVFSEIINSRR